MNAQASEAQLASITTTRSLLIRQREILEAIVRGDPLPDILAALCLLVESEANDHVRASILLVDDSGPCLRTGAAPSLPDDYNSAVDGIGIAPGVGTCADAAATGRIIVTRNFATDPAWDGLRHLPMGLGLHAAWSMPIRNAAGKTLATFGTYFPEPREPVQEERELVGLLAQTAALAIERDHDDARLRASERRHRFLAELAAAMQPLDDAEDVMATSATLLAEHLGVDRCAYAEIEGATADEAVFVITGDYIAQHSRHDVPSIVGRWDVRAFGNECTRQMLEGESYVVHDSEDDPRITPDDRPAYRATMIRAVICVPLLKRGRFTAAMAVHQKVPRAWTHEEIELVGLVVARCWETLERLRAQAAVRRDIIARAEADRALAQSRQRLDIAVRLSGVGFWYCDLPFDELVWDERTCAHFFMPPDPTVTILDFYARLHPEDREPTRRAIDAAISQQAAYDIVYRTVHPLTGAWKWIRALGGTTYAPDGTPTRFDGVTLDVTAERTAQQHLARLLESERANARLLARVAEAARTIHACDSVDNVLRAVADASRRIIGAHSTTATLAGEASIDDAHGWLVAPMIGQDGVPLGEVRVAGRNEGAFTDSDEAILRQFAQIAAVALENARLYERLRDQDRRKDEFLATLAHELRNPLAPIRTGLHILRMTSDPAMATKSREVMERQVGHLVRLVDDLLDVSRITRGKVTLSREPLDLHDVVDTAVELSRPMIDAHAHTLHLNVPDHPLPLDGDRTRLAQALANLLNNAAKYTPPGGRIAVDVEPAPGAWRVRVRDNGIGIPADMLGRVFEMFTQVDHSIDRAQGGLGIGLTLVRRLVELHDGSVDVASEGPGTGSTFTVQLPRK